MDKTITVTTKQEAARWIAVTEALSELYQVYYRANCSNVSQHRMDIEEALTRLMGSYDTWLG